MTSLIPFTWPGPVKRFFQFFYWRAPESLFGLIRTHKRPSQPGLTKLYILQTDFPVGLEARRNIEASLAPIKEKYGIDFLVLEPGINLKRFDDI